MGKKYSNDEVKQALNGDTNVLTEDEKNQISEYTIPL